MSATEQRPLALVTGASTGIGYELAKVFAENGFDLIVAAENDEIRQAGEEFRQAGAGVEVVQVDLATEAGVEALERHIHAAARPLEAAALNAGIGAQGTFATESDLSEELKLVDLNVRSTVHVAKYVPADMVKRGEGRVLFTSSIASTMPGPFSAVYAASKSFMQSFAMALREELSGTGVTVTSLMPGPTDTEFFARADMEDTKLGANPDKDSPADVALDRE
jgi:short-subunit dehydrogenase